MNEERKKYHEEERKRFDLKSEHHDYLLKLAADIEDCNLSFWQDSLDLKWKVTIRGPILLDEIVVPWNYDSFRLISAALQGLNWFDSLNEKIANEPGK